MLRWLGQRAEVSRRAEELYGSVVTAARQPAFYEVIGVPDTPEGRFELVALHLFLALETAQRRETASATLVQRTIEAFVIDMDNCMREMGVGDLTVPKKVKRAAAAFYERAKIYRGDLAETGLSSLSKSLNSYVFSDNADRQNDSVTLARYLRAAASALADRSFEEFVNSGMASRLLAVNPSKTWIETT